MPAMSPPHRVMIVDDDEAICRSLARIFRARGYEVVTAYSSQNSVDEARDSGVLKILSKPLDLQGLGETVWMSGRIDREQLEKEGRLPGSATWMEKPLDMNALIGQLRRSDEQDD